jgi:hypothetical protein
LAAAFVFCCAAGAAFAGDDGRRDRVMVFGGALMEGHFPGSSIIPFGSGFDGNGIAGAAYSRRLHPFSNGIEIGAELGLAARFGRDLTGEAWAGFSLGHEGFTYGPVTVAPAVVLGLSAVTGATGIEARRAGKDGDPTLLFYLGPEIAFRHQRFPNVELVYRIHHRSGAWKVLGNMRDGYNGNIIGVRFGF